MARSKRRVRLPQLVRNPAWADKVLAEGYNQFVEDGVIQPTWMPKLTDLHLEGSRIAGRFREFGCGTYGCVYPTFDDNVVLKVTSDTTETEFAVELSAQLVEPVCVRYHKVVDTGEKHQGRPISLLWRESAFNVGKIAEVSESIAWGAGMKCADLIAEQWRLAQDALHLLWDGDEADDELAAWAASLEDMSAQQAAPLLNSVAEGMLRIYRQQHVFFGDVHAGNLGQVDRDGVLEWVITDPGNIVVLGAHGTVRRPSHDAMEDERSV
jgi:hypothetical protein